MVMTVKKILVTFYFILFSYLTFGQDTWYGSTSGMKSMFNPAFSGAAGKTALRISSCSFLPGGGFGLNSLFASIDGFVPQLHGGASLWISNDFLGDVTNELQSGVTYAYHLKAGENLFFNAGMTASVINIGINRSELVFPDDLDPYGGVISASDENYSGSGITRFDIGSGFTVASGVWYGGFAVMHLARPYMSESQKSENRLPRKYIVEGGTEIPFGSGDATISPSLAMIMQGKGFIADAGFSVSLKQLSAALSCWYIKDGMTAIQTSAGWIGKTTSLCLSYSYNLDIPQNTLPSTAIVKLSVSIFFNDVEKRKVFHIIKLPEM